MHNYFGVLVVVGSLCLTITPVLAWCLVGVRTSSRVRKLFPSVPNLLKAHIDYLLMTGLLMIGIIGFGMLSDTSRMRVPRPPQNRTVFISAAFGPLSKPPKLASDDCGILHARCSRRQSPIQTLLQL